MKVLRSFPIVAASAMLLVAGCSREFAQGPVDSSSGQEISFRTMGGATKSAVSGTAFPQGYDILVSAYHNPVSASGADYFEGIPFGYDAVSGSWKSEKGPKYYPMEGTLDFLAVASAGYNNPDAGIAPTAVWGEDDNAARKVVLTVPDNSAKFDDLMYGAANGCSSGTSGSALVLRHAMTSVVFFAKSNVAYDASTNTGITITGITLDGAKFSGTLTVSNPSAGGGSGDLTAAWSSLGDQKDHIAARLWNSANSGVLTNESALSALHLSTTAGSLSTAPFGEAYVILPPQSAVPFTISYTIHNGFASDGVTPVDTQFQTQITPSGNWDMEKKNVYAITINGDDAPVVIPTVIEWDLSDGSNEMMITLFSGDNSSTGGGDFNQEWE